MQKHIKASITAASVCLVSSFGFNTINKPLHTEAIPQTFRGASPAATTKEINCVETRIAEWNAFHPKKVSSVIRTAIALKGNASNAAGVLISNDGHVLTCAHTLIENSELTAELSDNQLYNVHIVAVNWDCDLAILQIQEQPVGHFAERMHRILGLDYSKIQHKKHIAATQKHIADHLSYRIGKKENTTIKQSPRDNIQQAIQSVDKLEMGRIEYLTHQLRSRPYVDDLQSQYNKNEELQESTGMKKKIGASFSDIESKVYNFLRWPKQYWYGRQSCNHTSSEMATDTDQKANTSQSKSMLTARVPIRHSTIVTQEPLYEVALNPMSAQQALTGRWELLPDINYGVLCQDTLFPPITMKKIDVATVLKLPASIVKYIQTTAPSNLAGTAVVDSQGDLVGLVLRSNGNVHQIVDVTTSDVADWIEKVKNDNLH